MPKHRLEDFAILQQHQAAVTIFDVPINLATVITMVRLVFIQTVLLALAAVNG